MRRSVTHPLPRTPIIRELFTLTRLATIASTVPLHAAEPMQPSGAAQALMSDSPKKFFETAASATLFEIEASKVALAKSKDPQVRTFVQMMIKDHAEAGQKLTVRATTKNVSCRPNFSNITRSCSMDSRRKKAARSLTTGTA